MKPEFLHHKLAYIVLIFALLFFTISFMGVWPSRPLQRVIIFGLVTFYFIWGLLVHHKEEYLSRRIILEYLSISVLAGALLLFITL